MNDEESFLTFAKALQADKEDETRKQKENPANPYSHGWNGWENNTMMDFLSRLLHLLKIQHHGTMKTIFGRNSQCFCMAENL